MTQIFNLTILGNIKHKSIFTFTHSLKTVLFLFFLSDKHHLGRGKAYESLAPWFESAKDTKHGPNNNNMMLLYISKFIANSSKALPPN
jgi:hypothetical protein